MWNNIVTNVLNDETCMHTKKTILMENSSAWYKLHSGSLWFIRHPSVKAQTRLLRRCSVSMVINEEAHGATAGSVADPSPRLRRMLCFKANPPPP